ncbi:hypothetical protein PUN28_006554 [Cardiocondyla obscurior]|uniref:Pro-resilin n=1 Tax=Cardiocondyla obscurior TaxID=286306 RepID=A0AAW2GB44_9HYME
MSPGIYKDRRGPRALSFPQQVYLALKGQQRHSGRANLPWRDRNSTSLVAGERYGNRQDISGVTLIMMLAVVWSEPPVNTYLPPRTGTSSANNGRTDLSAQYGPPDFSNRGNVDRNAGATSFGGPGVGNGPSKLYDAPVEGNGNSLGQFRGNGFGGGRPSGSYGVPGGFDENRASGGRPSASYGLPGANGNVGGGFRNAGNENNPSTGYGVPDASNRGGFGNGGRPSTNYGVPGNDRGEFGHGDAGERPSSSYGAPGANGNVNGRPSSSYGAPDGTGNTISKGRFNGGDNGPPSSSYGSPNELGGGLSTSYSPPNRGGNNGYASTSSNERNFASGRTNGGYPSGGPIGNGDFRHDDENFGGRGGGGSNEGYNSNAQEESSEPAKYEFSYKVKDQRTGSDYSHTETRNGDRAQGEFNVLLPDGRKQIVEYEADQDGFKPQIRYEGEANAGGGYGSGGPSDNNNGYSSGRPGSEGGFVNNSGFNGGGSNAGYSNGGPEKSDGFNSGGGYQSGRPAGQSFGRDNNNGLSGDTGGYFSNPPSNNIGNDNEGNRQDGGHSGYQY